MEIIILSLLAIAYIFDFVVLLYGIIKYRNVSLDNNERIGLVLMVFMAVIPFLNIILMYLILKEFYDLFTSSN